MALSVVLGGKDAGDLSVCRQLEATCFWPLAGGGCAEEARRPVMNTPHVEYKVRFGPIWICEPYIREDLFNHSLIILLCVFLRLWNL